MATTIGNLITLDGQFADWPADDSVMTSGNTVAGYQVYGAFLDDATLGNTDVLGIDATAATDQVIGANTFIYLNTDQNTATGYDPFGDPVGAEYEVQLALDSNNVLQPYLYSVTSAGVATLLNGGAPLNYGISSNGESVELAIPQALLTPAGGAAPTSISFATLINNGAAALPSDLTDAQYTITDPATLVPVNTAIKKVGIVYSATTAALYFGGGQAGETAYSDLFMSAQHQAEAAGVSYDILTEADLTNVALLSQYSALIFPSFQDVQSSQVSAIANALSQVVYNYHVPIITAGDFMTNDQLGNALPGNSYANMVNLLNLTQSSYGTATYSVTPDPTALANKNPVIAGYTAGQLIGGASGQFAGTTAGYYTNTGYLTFSGDTQPATTLADINIQGGAIVPGVVQTTTGGTNTVFSTTGLLGDSNLLQHVIQNAVFGTTPSLAMDITRFAGVLNSRNDTEDAQYPADVSPTNGDPGIYSQLIPMLQQWQQQYDFVGSYFINVGDDANPDNGNSTNWSVSLPYYDELLQMGNEIGSHSYTHLINPPTVDANGNPVPNTTVTTGDGTQTVNSWSENTNTLYVTPPANGSAPNWTFAYEFGTGNSIMESNIGIPIAGAAVPGANDTVATSDNIEQYYQTSALPAGVTGYVEGGWTGVGSGAPNAFGYIDPSDTGSVYIAPNITFDFTEIQYDNKTPAQADADWESLFNQLSANSATPIIVWPWHDYGPTDWNDDNPGTPGTLAYDEAMYTNFIAYAYNAGYEFVTSEDLASRIAAEQAATLSETTSGNVITATVTPAPTEPDLGAMALNVVNGAAGQVIQNAGIWYAYDSQSVFMPYGGGTFNVTLGTTQDDVTHVDYLPMRADLQSVTGDGSNLTFSFTGDGTVDVHVKTPGTNVISVLASAAGTGAGPVSATLVGDDLSLVFNDGPLAISSTSPQGVPVLHTVAITEGPTAVGGATFSFAPPIAITGTAAGQATTDLTTIAPFSKVTITDSNISQTETVTVTLSAVANGTLSNLGGGSYNSVTGVYSDTGTAAAVTAALDALVFTPTANQVAPGQTVITGFTITDTDTAGVAATDSTTTVVATDVAVPPTIAGTIAGQPTTDLATIAPFSKVTIADLNLGQTETVTVTLSAVANGTLSNLGGGSYSAMTGVYTDTGTAAVVTAALDALVFTPTANQVVAGQTVNTSFTIADTDTAGGTATDSTTSVVTTALQPNRILLQNTSGQAEVWQVNGTAISSSSLVGGNPGPFWSLVGTGAFFAGDTGDYLWRGANGSVGLWQMSGTTIESHSVIAGNPGTSWLIAGTGDFYGDGHTDILWQNDNGSVGLWDMNGATVSQLGVVAGNPGPTWHIRGTGDFYGDGHTDILWQNDSGSVGLWDMNGTTVTQLGVVAGNPGPTWHIMGTGDFYGDGHTDILWQNDGGSVGLWEMNGTTVSRLGVVAGNPGPTWHIVGTGDFNGDGKTDIVWRNDNGSVGVWDMNGTTILASGVLANPGVSWSPSGIDSMRFIYPTSNDAQLAATPAMPDEFVLTSLAPGSQTITGFDPMQDVIELSKAQFASFTQVQAAITPIAGGAMIGLGNGSLLLLPGVNPESLHASNFAWA